MNKTHKISFRVSDYEHKLVQSKVKKSGIRMSDFCRYAVLGKEIRTVKGLDKCSYNAGTAFCCAGTHLHSAGR